jgi:copper chaperone
MLGSTHIPLARILRRHAMSVTSTTTYTLTGMTCGHCVASVEEEVGALPGVETVDVDLASGRLSVTGAGVGEEAVRAAVAEAGYEVAP